MKKLCLTLIALISIFSLVACGAKVSAEIQFCTRSAYAVSSHLGDDPEKAAVSYNASYIEYVVENGYECSLIEAVLRMPDNTYVRNVYMLSTGGKYYEDLYAEGKAIYDSPTELYIVNRGDAVINKQKEYSVDSKTVSDNFKKFINNGDLALIGME